MELSTDSQSLLAKPSGQEYPTMERKQSIYNPLPTYILPRGEAKHYQQQFADMYFARLALLKPAVKSVATEAFSDFEVAGEQARYVDRVLDVRQGDLCWVIGTVYMDMPLKPNVLDDLGKEHWIAAPPPRQTYTGAGEQVMLEDESGRLRLTGASLRSVVLVTGAIIAVLGTENADGDFEVLDLRTPDLPRQPTRWERDDGDAAMKGKSVLQKRPSSGKVAIVSGLAFSGDEGDSLAADLLLEWLLGETSSPSEQTSASEISRLIIAGNSFSHSSPIPSREDMIAAKKYGAKKYGYDAAAYNAAPSERLDHWLSSLLPSLPITLRPGSTDPTSTVMPQQPIHAAMFPHSRPYMDLAPSSPSPSWFDSTTNPVDFDCDGWRFLVGGGQTLDDVLKYISSSDERVEMMEAMLRWRLTAPTAPDTLPCYPFQDGDRFVLKECPHVYVVGNQPRFETGVVEGPLGQMVRLVAVPKFKETGEVVLLDMETLEVEIVKVEIVGGE
jgi:DNA polymerase delta subunit 2